MLRGSVAIALLAVSVAVLPGCATHQEVTLAKAKPSSQVVTAARSPSEGNSPEMDAKLIAALQQRGVQVKKELPAGSRTAADVDTVVSYTDVWRWDVVMYLKSLSVSMFDAKSGDLLVSGKWEDSAMHGFRDAQEVMNGLIDEMLMKVRTASAGK